MEDINYKKGEEITFKCFLINILLTVFKGVVGFVGGSRAMVADAFHSASDVIATLVVYICLKIAKKPKDENHHYGHGKVEFLSSAFVGFSLIIAGITIIKEIIELMIEKTFVTPTLLTLITAVVSIIIKESMFRVTFKIGDNLNSDSIKANAWDHRSDAYSSIGAFIGILSSMIGQKFEIEIFKYFDSIAGILIGVIIFITAIKIIINAIKKLMDTSPDKEMIDKIRDIIYEHEEVNEITWVRARYSGQKLIVDLAIEIDYRLTIEEGHKIAKENKLRVLRDIDEVGQVTIHVNPSYSVVE